ncbi:MAG TPA: DUF4129 domain-containing protein [Lacipirellulaceae bacterium]|nr:DUF4129 domain-containing protein [Lacipirellulaceae bacterium]
MAKRLYMTSADYLVIAVSPALIMALVGSLVFFLIDVLYVGQYEVRLDYAFALFVFAAVLIARIAIEMGSERASLFALPLGLAMFLVLVKFVEHPSPYTHIINLALMCLVWWCADRLTWDSTVIDDDEDASGEGLMQRIGVDGPEQQSDGTNDNELLADRGAEKPPALQRLKRLFLPGKGAHTPGVWVLYFSLAALPLFGIGQHWIPVAEVGRRRYAFGLLLVYVFAALSLLVTTSFLNMRRYLRQRRVEMPLPIAGTWVGFGAVLIVMIMLLAMLIPRPGAEVALSRVPWQVGSPGGLAASRNSIQRDGGEEQQNQASAEGGKRAAKEGQASLPPTDKESGNTTASSDTQGNANKPGEQGKSDSANSGTDNERENSVTPDSAQRTKQSQTKSNGNASETSKSLQANNAHQASDTKQRGNSGQPSKATPNKSAVSEQKPTSHSGRSSTQFMSRPLEAMRSLSSSIGGMFGVLKIVFYIVAALVVGFCVWTYRHQIMQSIEDILRQIRELFGGRRDVVGETETEASSKQFRSASFSDFSDPFLGGQHAQMSPEELVRYTFAAFEAWANDRGRPRTPDCTPQELIRMAVEPQTPLFDAARRMVRMYGEVAYASRRISRDTAEELREMWQLMRSTYTWETTAAGRT